MDLLKNRQRDLGGLFLVVGCSALSSLPRRLLTDAFDVPVRGGIRMRTAAVDHPFERLNLRRAMPNATSPCCGGLLLRDLWLTFLHGWLGDYRISHRVRGSSAR
jgi:hypothetical protein